MQKKLIALAVAGMMAAPVAMAQSNVTVYGLVDMGYLYEKAGDRKVHKFDPGLTAGSRIGFRGAEDLGNGLKAVFTLEYGSLDLDRNSGLTGSRQSFVGLEGGFGFVGLGRQYSPGFFTGTYDASQAQLWGPHQILAHRTTTRIASSGRARIDNAINYKSPNFGGVTVNAIYGLSERADSDRRQGDLAAIGANYAAGPIAAGLIYSNVSRQGLPGGNQKEWFIGASYDFGVAKVLGSWQRNKVDDSDKLWQLGVAVPVSEAGTVALAHGRLNHGASSSLDANATSLSYTHNLSRRTMLYAGYSHVNNKSLQTASIFAAGLDTVGGSAPAADGAPAGKNARGLALGVRHTF